MQEGGYLPGLRVGSGPTLRNELSKETHVLTKQETLLGRGAQAEELPKWHQRTCLPMQETSESHVQSLGQEDLLEEGMTTHSSILAWRFPWTEEAGRLQSIVSHRVRQ